MKIYKMKKIIYLSICFSCCLPLQRIEAQGVKAIARATIIEYPENRIRATVLSRNGQYAVLPSSDGIDVLDLKANKKTTYLRKDISVITGVADNGIMCGHLNLNPDGESFGLPRVYRNGVWQNLGLSYNAIRTDWPEFNFWRYLYPVGISSDGSKIVGQLTYDGTWVEAEGGGYVLNIRRGGAIWDENGKLDSVKGYEFRSISGNGKVLGTQDGRILRNDSLIVLSGVEDDMTTFINENGDKALLRNPYAVLGYTARIWENGKKDLLQIPLIKGYINCRSIAMSENGFVVGYVQKEEDFLKRSSIWSEKMGNVFLSDYLKELYGLDSLPWLYECYNISADGKVMIGTISNENYNVHPCIIKITGEPLLSRPMNLIAKGVYNKPKARLLWEKPIYCGKDPVNYRVYRNGKQIAEFPATIFSHIDSLSNNGEQSYTVTAVYDNGESAPTDAQRVNILGANECQPIRFFAHTLVYNRNVNLYWHLPTANLADKKNEIENKPVKNSSNYLAVDTNNPWEEVMKVGNYSLAGSYNMMDYSRVCIVRVGDYYYTSTEFMVPLYKSDLEFRTTEELKFPNGQNCPFSVDMTTDGTYIYGVKNASKLITVIDPEVPAVVKQISIKNDSIHELRHIAYVPELDNGKGGFAAGDWSSNAFYRMDGTKIEDGVKVEYCEGMTYLDGKLYASQQSGKKFVQVIEHDIKTKKATGLVFDAANYPDYLKNMENAPIFAGGICTTYLEDSTLCLAQMVRCNQAYRSVLLHELHPSPQVKGYNVYKDGVLITKTPIVERNFTSIEYNPGTYVYQVTPLKESGCEGPKSDSIIVTIQALGTCYPVTNIKAVESDKNMNLSFDLPKENGNSQIQGFNIYRDGDLLNEELVTKLRYQDKNRAKGEYLYRIEAFYDNSCVASDSILAVVTYDGICGPINNLNLTSTQIANKPAKFNVSAHWELPYFEAPLSITYASDATEGVMGLPDGGDLTVAAAWHKKDLDMYKDYSVVGIEIVLRDEAVVAPIVLVDDKIVYHEKTGRLRVDKIEQIMLSQSIPLASVKEEIAVGYTATHEAGTLPIGYDGGPAKVGYSDLFSIDLLTWGVAATSLNANLNWNIKVLLAKPRSVNAIQNPLPEIKIPEIVAVDLASLTNIRQKAVSKKIESQATELLGFDIYRDGTKLNNTPLKALSYLDENISEGNYEYMVNSLWNKGEAVHSKVQTIHLMPTSLEKETLNKLRLYPNPIKDNLQIEGIYQSLKLMDIYGRILLQEKQVSTLCLSSFSKGVYFLSFELKDGSIVSKRIVKE